MSLVLNISVIVYLGLTNPVMPRDWSRVTSAYSFSVAPIFPLIFTSTCRLLITPILTIAIFLSIM